MLTRVLELFERTLAATAVTYGVRFETADIREFALQCRDGARQMDGDAAALILLAEKASAFFERHEGVALANDSLHDFVETLAADVSKLHAASKEGDAAIVNALNEFAAAFSKDLVV